MPAKQTLPKILCLHGAGSSGAIFKVQGRKIFSPLRHKFEFVFIDALFRSTAGPGMRPTFESSGPFFRWQCDMSATEAFDITEEEVKEETRKIEAYLERHILQSDGAPYVGIMAFSQGARVAAGLLMWLEKRSDIPPIKFAIFNSATYPPLLFDQEDATTKSVRLRIPSLHLQGSIDPWRSESEKMRQEFFDMDMSKVIEFEGQHQIPVAQGETEKIVAEICLLAAKALPEKI